MSFFEGATESTIFAERKVLDRDYCPDEIVGREDEKEQIHSEIRDFLNGMATSQVFFVGPNGTGKTATAKWTRKELEKLNDDRNDPESKIHTYFVYCPKSGEDEYQVLLSLTNKMLLDIRDDPDLLSEGIQTGELRRRFGRMMDEHQGRVLVILDEIDVMNTEGLNNSLDLFSRPELFETPTALIATANEQNIIANRVENRVLSAMSQSIIQFDPYDANNLRNLLSHRANLAFKDGVLDDEVVPLAGALAAQYDGDARYAVDLLHEAGKKAEAENTDIVKESHVRNAQEKVKVDELEERVDGMTGSMKLLLLAGCVNQVRRNDGLAGSTTDVFARYQRLTDAFDASQIGRRQAQKHLRTLEEQYGLTASDFERAGENGTQKSHRVEQDPLMLAQAIIRDSRYDVKVLNELRDAQDLMREMKTENMI